MPQNVESREDRISTVLMNELLALPLPAQPGDWVDGTTSVSTILGALLACAACAACVALCIAALFLALAFACALACFGSLLPMLISVVLEKYVPTGAP